MQKRVLSVTGRSSGWRRSCLCALGAALLLGAALFGPAGCGKEKGFDFAAPPPPPSAPWLFDVWGRSANDVYIVGRPDVLLHYDGTHWESQQHPSAGTLTAVWGTGPDSVFAVGYHGAILFSRGSGWAAMGSGTSNDLYDIGRGPGGGIYACGQKATVIKLNGGGWSDTPDMVVQYNNSGTATTDTLFRSESPTRSATSIGNYMVAGNYGMILMTDSIPSRWRFGPIATEDWLNASWGSSIATDNWLVSDEGRLYRLQLNGRLYSWLEVSSPGGRIGIDAMWGAPNAIDYYFVNRDGQILHRSANSTAPGDIMYQGQFWLSGIWGSAPNDIWAVGVNGTVLHYDGTSWTPVTVPLPQNKALDAATDKFGRPVV